METSAPTADNAFCKDMAWSSWDMLPREARAVWEQSHWVFAAEFCSPPDLWSLIGV